MCKEVPGEVKQRKEHVRRQAGQAVNDYEDQMSKDRAEYNLKRNKLEQQGKILGNLNYIVTNRLIKSKNL